MKNIKQRTCIGCNRLGFKNEFIRLTAGENKFYIDTAQELPGRGIYLCPSTECLKKAIKRKAFSYRLKARFDQEAIHSLSEEFTNFITG